MHLLPASASEDMEARGFPRRQCQLGQRQEAAGEQVEEAGKACQTRQDPEPQGQVLQGALQLGVQEDDLAFGDAPLPRVVEDVAGHAGLVLQGQLGLDPGLCILPVQVVPLHQPRQLRVPITEDGAGVLLSTAGPSLPPTGKSRVWGGSPFPQISFRAAAREGGDSHLNPRFVRTLVARWAPKVPQHQQEGLRLLVAIWGLSGLPLGPRFPSDKMGRSGHLASATS